MARVTEAQSSTADRKIATPSSILARQSPGSRVDHMSPSKSDSPGPAAQARHVEETLPDRTGMRFASPIFTILVGEDKYMFMAHESVLSQSPVLSRFCKGNFKEAATMEITLPTESRECIGRLLEYLYTGDYACCSAEKAFDEAAELAGMYIAADKYNLPELKRITMKKLASLESFPVDGIDLFSLARLVYSHIPDSDKHFRAYFASYAPVQLMQMEEPDLNQLEEMMKSGGIFAQDCFRAQKLACERKMQVAKRAAEDAPLPPPPPPPKKPARAPSSKAKKMYI